MRRRCGRARIRMKSHRIGQTAQERIYISWEDAVRRAEKRYGEILAERPNGAARPRRDVFPFLSDALEAVTRCVS